MRRRQNSFFLCRVELSVQHQVRRFECHLRFSGLTKPARVFTEFQTAACRNQPALATKDIKVTDRFAIPAMTAQAIWNPRMEDAPAFGITLKP